MATILALSSLLFQSVSAAKDVIAVPETTAASTGSLYSSPNVYSSNLLQNIADAQGGDLPVIRVGGNSQDRAIYDSSLTVPTATSCAADPEAILCIGNSLFDSYGAFPNGTKYSHGFNLAANNASGYETLTATVPLACQALQDGLLEVWELGNEPDLYRGKWRPSDWTEAEYTTEWLNGTDRIRTLLQQSCPELASQLAFMAPSLSSPGSALKLSNIFAAGLDKENTVKQISVHNYMSGATSPGVTLQSTLMNHTAVVQSITKHVQNAQSVASVPADYILGEHNSLYGGGAAGLSNTFGAALWVLEFSAYAASTGVIKRLHFHQSQGAAYSAWTPVGSPATNPPYYGKLAAATFLGASSNVQVKEVSLPAGSDSDLDSAYAAYVDGNLTRLAVLNLRQYDSTSGGARPSQNYTIQVPTGSSWTVKRLTAAGSDVTTGVTFNGFAYEYESLGQAVRVNGTTSDEKVTADENGTVTITVRDSEAVIATIS
ncbi:Glycoside hydrolase family 79 protein [Rasamsonia emersonii CBS 393.64]|uniref:Glycoside hydrolase family 79 protein n=1 Tax=Rasamsonia emersonii (strain ATCC 16479 / CBS 393.64 / IMI 116815) TaxID=1408163 RepID=A0A0F4YRI0_RASE3|nr:Glycoside hydrolase family 79 protein [Rasamsonia emersonii CBS 393.64]KKA20897.1 Glycoside hydrolase family 79 protein [Rasamsonia emersonii CBS 393.64]